MCTETVVRQLYNAVFGGSKLLKIKTKTLVDLEGFELTPSQARSLSSYEVTRRWREMTGAIPGVVELKYTASMIGSPGAIDIQLTGPDIDELRVVADQAKAKLAEYPGVYDVTDSFREGKPEIKLAIRSSAEALGLSLQDLARQVRQGFYGEEAQRIQRGRDDVRVMVRYPRQERRSLGDLETMRVRTPEGAESSLFERGARGARTRIRQPPKSQPATSR